MPKIPQVDLKSAFSRATEENVPPDELLAAVRRLVRDLKRQGRPPEQVIVAVKQACGLPLITFAGDTDAIADGSQTKRIAEMMVRAAIDEYYKKSRRNGDLDPHTGVKR
jgi:hypothetical protein